MSFSWNHLASALGAQLALLAGAAWWPCGMAADPPAGQLLVATFSCDVTPPKGQPLFSGDPLETVAAPLLAKGVLIESAGARVAGDKPLARLHYYACHPQVAGGYEANASICTAEVDPLLKRSIAAVLEPAAAGGRSPAP